MVVDGTGPAVPLFLGNSKLSKHLTVWIVWLVVAELKLETMRVGRMICFSIRPMDDDNEDWLRKAKRDIMIDTVGFTVDGNYRYMVVALESSNKQGKEMKVTDWLESYGYVLL